MAEKYDLSNVNVRLGSYGSKHSICPDVTLTSSENMKEYVKNLPEKIVVHGQCTNFFPFLKKLFENLELVGRTMEMH